MADLELKIDGNSIETHENIAVKTKINSKVKRKNAVKKKVATKKAPLEEIVDVDRQSDHSEKSS